MTTFFGTAPWWVFYLRYWELKMFVELSPLLRTVETVTKTWDRNTIWYQVMFSQAPSRTHKAMTWEWLPQVSRVSTKCGSASVQQEYQSKNYKGMTRFYKMWVTACAAGTIIKIYRLWTHSKQATLSHSLRCYKISVDMSGTYSGI